MNKLKDTEIELTFPLKNPEELEEQLNDIAEFQDKDVKQEDTYYIPPHHNFIKQNPIREWLRLRETVKGTVLNYKFWHNADDQKAVSCDEYETKLTDAEAIKEILKRLDFIPIIIVDKKRSTWLYQGVEIAIDEVTGLGFYIELEAKGEFKNIAEAKEHLYKVLKELKADVGEQDYKGYPHLLLEKEGLL
ncbi:MAG: class IV adenylate cyclase [Patescibacteria group bacterium]